MFSSHRIRRIILAALFLLCIGGSFIAFFRVNSGDDLYGEYMKLWDYRRLHPEYQPDARGVTAFVSGHSTSYADLLWINLIQYIADNIGNGKYVDYATPLLETISELHPYFTRSYTLALLLTPSLDRNGISFQEKNIGIGKKNLALGVRGIQKNCDAVRMQAIEIAGIQSKPWENPLWKNPCSDGYLPYYAAYVADGLGERSLAQEYYTLASAHEDAPQASRFLAILMQGKSGDRLDAALQFYLIASSGYDESPFVCREYAIDMISRIGPGVPITPALITLLERYDRTITAPKDLKNPLARSTTNCFESFHRGTKQFYLAYITEVSQGMNDVKDGESLLKKGLLQKIPKPFGGEDLSVIRQSDGRWEYRKIYH